MTAAPRTAQPSAPRPGAMTSAARFLRAIYGGQDGGWFEVCYCAGDPANPAHKVIRHSWQRYDAETLPAACDLMTQLSDQYGDVYVSRTCYTRKERNAA